MLRFHYSLSALLLTAGLAWAQLPPAHSAFDRDAVHELRITFTQPDFWDQLTYNYENFDDVPYIEASLKWGDRAMNGVGVRFKGNSSYNGATTKKKPFRIKLNEFTKGQKIDGTASFSLSNAWNDPSFVREKLYYELAYGVGLKSPRSNFAAIYINNVYWGLYVMTEVVNGDFLTAFFGKGDDTGNLYKADDIGANLAYLGEDKEAYKGVWAKQSNETADDWTDLIALTKLINDTPAAELHEKLEPIMDTESVMMALALDNITVNLDSYVGMAQNFYLYRRPSDNRWVWIVWDPSLAFGALAQGLTAEQMKQLSLEWTTATTGLGFPGGGELPPGGPGGPGNPGERPGGPGGIGNPMQGGRPLATKLWESPVYKERYRQIYHRLATEIAFPESILARMNEARDMIRPWVEKDTQKLVTQEQFDKAMTTDQQFAAGGANPGGLPGGPQLPPGGGPGGPGGPGGVLPGGMGSVPGLNAFVTDRITWVRQQLAK